VVRDYSGHSRQLNFGGATSVADWIFDEGNTISTNGAGTRYLQTDSGTNYDYDQITVAGWINLQSENFYASWLNNSPFGTGAEGGWILQPRGINSDWRFWVSDGTTFAFTSGPDPVNDIGKWVHVAGSYDGSTIRLYHSGTLVDSTAFTGGIGATGDPFTVGLPSDLNNPTVTDCDSYNDDIAIYNRALSPPEIRLLATRRGIAYELDTYVTQWGSVAAASAFQAAWGANATTIAGVASGQ
jgi:hypothetical protein